MIKDGTAYIVDKDSLIKIDPNTGKEQVLATGLGYIGTMRIDDKNIYWTDTKDSKKFTLKCFDKTSKVVSTIVEDVFNRSIGIYENWVYYVKYQHLYRISKQGDR